MTICKNTKIELTSFMKVVSPVISYCIEAKRSSGVMERPNPMHINIGNRWRICMGFNLKESSKLFLANNHNRGISSRLTLVIGNKKSESLCQASITLVLYR